MRGWKKFLRSPLTGLVGGLLLSSLIESRSLFMLAVIGFERITVEFYKTFYTRGVRGIFRDRKPLYPEWFGAKRWMFFVSYSLGVGMIAVFLFTSVHSG